MSFLRLLSIVLLMPLCSWAQKQVSLDFSSPDTFIDHKFEFELRDFTYEHLMSITGEKMALIPTRVTYNTQPMKVKSCKTRGNTTLLFRRKSFSLSLREPVNFEETAVMKLAINNLAMDKNYWRGRLCFILMDGMGIFPLKNQFTEVRINEKTQGTYLMIQKPEDYCRRVGSKLLVRREGARGLNIEFAYDAMAKKSVKPLKKLKDLAKLCAGKTLYDTLSQIIDFNAYSKWLAFNYLIMNGDYLDELFLFLNPETNRFQALPWDYDDVFAAQPHEGLKRRDNLLGSQLLFSSESSLDLVIANDPYLYQQYLEIFKEVLTVISIDVLKHSFEQVFRELWPFYSDPEVIAQSQYDQSGLTNLDLLKEDLDQHYHFLIDRRYSIEATLNIDH